MQSNAISSSLLSYGHSFVLLCIHSAPSQTSSRFAAMALVTRRSAALFSIAILQLLLSSTPLALARAFPVLSPSGNVDAAVAGAAASSAARRDTSTNSDGFSLPAKIGICILGLAALILFILFIWWTEWRTGCTSCGGRRTFYSPTETELHDVWAAYGYGQVLEWTWMGKLQQVETNGNPHAPMAWNQFVGGGRPSKHKLSRLWDVYGTIPYSYSNAPAGGDGGGGG